MAYTLITNFIEPLAYLIFSIAFFFETRVDKAIKIKVLLVHYSVCTILMAFATWKAFSEQDNRWIYNLVGLQSAVLICYYFLQTFKDERRKKAIRYLIIANVVYFVMNNLVFRRFFLFDSIGYALLSASVSIIAFMYFYDVLKNSTERRLWNDFDFWLVSGYLFYFLVSFAIFLTYHYLTNKILDTFTDEERNLLTVLWGVQNVLLFLSAITTLSGSLWTTFRNRLY